MSAKQKMCTVMDLFACLPASLFASLMCAGLPNHFPLLTMRVLSSQVTVNCMVRVPAFVGLLSFARVKFQVSARKRIEIHHTPR